MSLKVKNILGCLARQSRGLRGEAKALGSHGLRSDALLPDQSSLKDLLDDSFVGTDILKQDLADPWSSSSFPVAASQRKTTGGITALPNLKPSESSVLLFPGQATHFVGMGRDLLKYPNVRELFACASELLKYDLLKMCIDGPLSDLEKTVHSQPAIFVTSIAAVEKLRDNSPRAVENCVAAAGYSIGEYAALVFSRALNFEAALNVVKVRAEQMQAASEAEQSGMATVFEHFDSDLEAALNAAKEHMREKGHPNPVCQVAAYLFSECKVIGGHQEAMKFLAKNASNYKIRVKRLPTSGAFHTPLMESAAAALKPVLDSVQFNEPLIKVFSNITGSPYRSAAEIPQLLLRQLTLPVKWEQSMHNIYDRKSELYPSTYEPGPGSQLGSMLKKINSKAHSFYKPLDV